MCNLHIILARLLPSRKMCILHIMLHMLDRLLAPLARLMVARSVLFPEFSETMKRHYVDAARNLAASKEAKVTASRLSVMTGLQRRDIARLADQDTSSRTPNPLSRLVALWQTDARFSSNGTAMPLQKTGNSPSFEALAHAVRRDVHPRTLLDALVAAGTAHVEGDKVILDQKSYQPLAGTDEQIAYLADNSGDHLAAAVDNVLGRDPRHFERALHYSGLTAEQVAELSAEFETAQMDLLTRLGQKAAAMKSQTTGPHRLRLGGYVYRSKGNQP